MKLSSPAFAHLKEIPRRYTCDGEDLSPPLLIEDAPPNTSSFALVVEDPDAPSGTFDHWIAWNIPEATNELAEGIQDLTQGMNHFHELRYRGPCPPKGKPHRYFFNLYALDVRLSLPSGSTKEKLGEIMEEHILASASLIGLYSR